AIPLTKACAISPVANTQRPAFTPCANLTLPGPSSTGSSGSTAVLARFVALFDIRSLHVKSAGRAGGRLWHCGPAVGRCGDRGLGTPHAAPHNPSPHRSDP